MCSWELEIGRKHCSASTSTFSKRYIFAGKNASYKNCRVTWRLFYTQRLAKNDFKTASTFLPLLNLMYSNRVIPDH